MPRASVPGFAGPSNRLRSPQADVEDEINWYLEAVPPGTGQKAQLYYAPRPGLIPVAQVADTFGRSWLYQDGRCFGLIGLTFFELLKNYTVIVYGSVSAVSNQSSLVSNGSAGHQLLICDGFNGYIFDLTANTFTPINGTNFPGTGFPVGAAFCVEFMDGYFLVVQRDSRSFFISALEDGTSWDPLDVFERSEGSDNLIGIRRNHREIWLPGSLTGEVWYDAGDPLNPFQPVPGVFLESGLVSNQALTRYLDSLAWVEVDAHGAGIVVRSNGYTATRISTHAVERDLQQAADLSASVLFPQQIQGHAFLWLYHPSFECTWVYDAILDRWHREGVWDTDGSNFQPHPARSHVYAWGDESHAVHLIQDWSSGVIYQMDLNTYTDGLVA